MDKSFRIKANIGSDQSININLKQDVDLYEILSLQLKQESLYKLHSSNYGVIVGRVNANDAFGVPNAKVTVFIPLSDVDSLRNDIKNIYPYKSVTDVDSRNVKFNTLPNYKKFACHQEVGSFPKKRLVLDDDSVLEVYDKYYKYSTVTNSAGDYMIFGVPSGTQTLHVDIDLSDIGILSQEPRDFIYKGYSMDMFESPTQFKKSTNLDSLPQIYNENSSVTVFPLWGDKTSNEISITRKDINIQYSFEPTCVFIGSVITDNGSNRISHNCIPDKYVGDASQLTPSKGDIEMIRKTVDDTIEEFPIKGNQLIDDDGTWCYQIPMNLDYVGTDEHGNIVPTNNPKKGIPTRARVRFRITLDESGEDSLSTHRARYLVPNNPDLYDRDLDLDKNENEEDYPFVQPSVKTEVTDTDDYYQFGTLTPDECFRDLYWNKVYTVKSYIPRLQMSAYEKTENYLAIKGVNKREARNINPIPFNKLNLNVSIPAFHILRQIFQGDGNIFYFWHFLKSYSVPYNIDAVRDEIMEMLDGVGLDFYNDWLNGCLYFPAWFWKIKRKKTDNNGGYTYESDFCECKNSVLPNGNGMFLYNNGSLMYQNSDLIIKYDSRRKADDNDEPDNKLYEQFNDLYNSISFGSSQFFSGIIKKMRNKDGLDIFYYSFGNKISDEIYTDGTHTNDEMHKYVRLFSTDIVLLGSLKECDIDGVPMVSHSMPSTTCNIPPMGSYKKDDSEQTTTYSVTSDSSIVDYESDYVSYNGMNWGQHWYNDKNIPNVDYLYHLGTGLFFGVGVKDVTQTYTLPDWVPFGGNSYTYTQKALVPFSDIKTIPNVERICELGVTLDACRIIDGAKVDMDGLITSQELEDIDNRGLFATLNHNKLIGEVENKTTGYKTYNLTYLYPTNFDGRLEKKASEYTLGLTNDYRNKDYLDFRFGSTPKQIYTTTRYNGANRASIINDNEPLNTEYGYVIENGEIVFNKDVKVKNRHFYGYNNDSKAFPQIKLTQDYYPFVFPLYDNSFYFYFGINQGSTAIDKLYEQFYTECKEEKIEKHIIKISTSASTECDENGVIKATIEEIEHPFTVQLLDANGSVLDSDYDASNRQVYNNRPNGEYYIKVIDSFGNEYIENVILAYQKISFSVDILRKIQTEYRNQTKEEIFNNDLYGIIQIPYYVLYGVKSNVSQLNGTIPDAGNTASFSLSDNVKLDIFLREEDNISNYIYSIDGNKINVVKPCVLNFVIYETCNGLASNNTSEKTISVLDTKLMELYINDVPLKYIVGSNESILPYNKYFHNSGETITSVTDTSIKGWFGVHNPEIYPEIFTDDLSNDSNKFELDIWLREENINSKKDIVYNKFKYLFNLSRAAYVTDEGNNTFKIRSVHSVGNCLIRSALPSYDDLSLENNETADTFTSFVIGENDSCTCNKFSPNIVSNNYCYVKYDDRNIGYNSPESAGITTYDFNPKYENSVNTACNYFAMFSNMANIIQTSDNTCRRADTVNYTSLPFNVHDLFKDDIELCPNGEIWNGDAKFSNALSKVSLTNRYFRTEFIDRRFDYDFVFITARKPNHFDAIDKEKVQRWNSGRISAVTYNGIEMLYDRDKNIISEADNTEYNYSLNNCLVSLKHSTHKRFYESMLYCDNNGTIDLRDGYDSKGYAGQIYYGETKCNRVAVTDGPSLNGEFGVDFENDGQVIYPTVRKLNYCDLPYSERYTFKNVSCSYDGIEITESNEKLSAKAKPGEVVSYSVEVGETFKIICDDFMIDSKNGKYNVSFYGSKNGYYSATLSSTYLKEIKFIIDANGSDGFKSKFGSDIGIRICSDNSAHTNLMLIKNSTTYQDIIEIITGSTLFNVTPNSGFIELEDVKNFEYVVTNLNLRGKNVKFLNAIFERYYINQEADSLMKKIKVINTSTIFNINDFKFTYAAYWVSTNNRNVTNFTIESPFISRCINDICFNITYEGDTYDYSLASDYVEITSRTPTSITFKVEWGQHRYLLFRPNDEYLSGEATVKVYMKIMNGFKSKYGEGHLTYSFGFKLGEVNALNGRNLKNFILIN